MAKKVPLVSGHIRLAQCKECGGDITFARTEAGKAMPIEPYIVDDGNVAVTRDHFGQLRCRVVSAELPLAPFERLTVHHRVKCPGKQPVQTEIPLPDNVVPLRPRTEIPHEQLLH